MKEIRKKNIRIKKSLSLMIRIRKKSEMQIRKKKTNITRNENPTLMTKLTDQEVKNLKKINRIMINRIKI
jgi:hypothetical protein